MGAQQGKIKYFTPPPPPPAVVLQASLNEGLLKRNSGEGCRGRGRREGIFRAADGRDLTGRAELRVPIGDGIALQEFLRIYDKADGCCSCACPGKD